MIISFPFNLILAHQCVPFSIFCFPPHVHRALTKWPGSTIGQCQGGGFITCIEYHHNFQLFPPFFFQLHVACSANFKFLSAQLVNVREAVWSSVSWCPIATYSCLPIHFLLLPQLLTSPTLVYEYKYTFTFQFTFYFYHNNLPCHPSSTNTNTNIQLPSSYILPQLLSSTSLVRKYRNTFTF